MLRNTILCMNQTCYLIQMVKGRIDLQEEVLGLSEHETKSCNQMSNVTWSKFILLNSIWMKIVLKWKAKSSIFGMI